MSDQVLELIAAIERVAASPAAIAGLLAIGLLVVGALLLVRGAMPR